jgi:predicted TIM-barrel fold metal-dependent hydrolase
MSEYGEPATATKTVDACVHPMPESAEEIRQYMPDPWRRHGFPGHEDYEYVDIAWPYADSAGRGGFPGADPALIAEHARAEGASAVILVPRTRGLLPDLDLSAAICSATNAWLAERWLDQSYGPEFLGTIRIDPRNPAAARAEIERWAPHPKMVQAAVTTQAQMPYGHRSYYPVWAALAEVGLPLLAIADGGSGIHFPVTVAGRPRYHIEKEVLYPANFSFHLASLLAEGVFERYPALKVIFGDGGHDMLTPIMWRLHKDWRGNRPEVPWLKRSPFEYLRPNVRFLSNALAGAQDEVAWKYWMDLSDADALLMFASKYPFRNFSAPEDCVQGLDPECRSRILSDNARDLYYRTPR